jgi:hypothetical protein
MSCKVAEIDKHGRTIRVTKKMHDDEDEVKI